LQPSPPPSSCMIRADQILGKGGTRCPQRVAVVFRKAMHHLIFRKNS
jgi:hypothetical protein